jgi:DNA-binding IclR family transcriptional regulator
VGQRLDLHSGATSKVFLAFAPEKFLKNYLDKNFIKKHTEKTILDRQLLLKDLKLVRERGYAISFHERFEEIGALAAPIFDHEKKLCASVGIAGAATRFKKNYKKKYLQHVLSTASSISSALGFSR